MSSFPTGNNHDEVGGNRGEFAAAHTECRFTPAWQPGTDPNLQRAGKQPSAATEREKLRWEMHKVAWRIAHEPKRPCPIQEKK